MTWDLYVVPNPISNSWVHTWYLCDMIPQKLMGRNPLECTNVSTHIFWITKWQIRHPASGGLYRQMPMSPQYRNHKSTWSLPFGTWPFIVQASNWALLAAVSTLQKIPYKILTCQHQRTCPELMKTSMLFSPIVLWKNLWSKVAHTTVCNFSNESHCE